MKVTYTFLSGIIIGMANVIPGVSGATLAISLGVYENLLEAITNFHKNIKKNLLFLLVLGLGALTGIFFLAKGIVFSFEKYQLFTVCFFIGLILGGIPFIFQKTNKKFNFTNLFIFIVSFAIIFIIGLINVENETISQDLTIVEYLKITIAGFIGSGSMIIPGISGAFILVVMGYYNFIIEKINDITNPALFKESIIVLLFFGIGVLLGIYLIAKIIKYLITKYQNITYVIILGIIFASIIVLLIPLLKLNIVFGQAIIALLLIDAGFFISYYIGVNK